MKTTAIAKLTGLRDAVKATLNSRTDLTAADKAWLCSLVDDQPEAVTAVRLDLHSHLVSGKLNVSFTLAPVF